MIRPRYLLYPCLFLLQLICPVYSQPDSFTSAVDVAVRDFLRVQQGKWQDMNIPASDGKVLFDLIVENGYTRALEIGTSTGHSAIWMAWALSKTGGRLTTIEINEKRFKNALDNFRKAGVDSLIDARHADAHQLVPLLEGPYDFIFIDADKETYVRYLKWLLPKMSTGGCFTAHNVLNTYVSGIREFLQYLESLPDLQTSIVRSSGSGISVSYKRNGR